eukprot:g68903.t1
MDALRAEIEDLKIDLEEAERKNEDYLKELKQLKNQDVAVRRLTAENKKLKDQLDRRDQNAVQPRDLQELERKLKALQEESVNKGKEYAALVENLQSQLAEAMRAHLVTQEELSSLRALRDQRASAAESGHELLQEDWHRHEMQLGSMRHENEHLHATIEQLRASLAQVSKHAEDSETLQATVLRLKQELRRAQELLEEATQRARSNEEYHAQQLAALHVQAEQSKQLVAQMEERLRSQPGAPNSQLLESLQAKASTLQEYEWLLGELEPPVQSVAALRGWLRSHADEAATVKNKMKTLESDLQGLEVRHQAQKGEIAQYKELIQKLEMDVADSARSKEAESDLSALLEEQQQQRPPPPPAAHQAALPASESEQTALLKIVTGQRDRYRCRLELLETSKDELQAKVQELSLAERRLRDENLALFEKLRYVQSYRTDMGAVDANARTQRAGAAARPGQASDAEHVAVDLRSSSRPNTEVDATESKYAALYRESRSNPFAEFRKRQEMESERALPALERLTLQVGRLILSKQGRRGCLLAYGLCLHLLVFFTITEHAILSHCR